MESLCPAPVRHACARKSSGGRGPWWCQAAMERFGGPGCGFTNIDCSLGVQKSRPGRASATATLLIGLRTNF